MRLFFFLLFIAVPLAELALLIKVGEIIGVGATILLVIATAVIGVSLLKRQGLAALTRARQTVEAGEVPVESVVDGACLLVAGAFLLTPGLITDTIGFSLLVPAVRHSLAHWLLGKMISSGNMHVHTYRPGGPHHGTGQPPPSTTPEGQIIEGKAEEISEDEDGRPGAPSGGSPWRR